MPTERTAQPEEVWPDGGHLPDDSARIIEALTARCNDAERNLACLRRDWYRLQLSLGATTLTVDETCDRALALRDFWELAAGRAEMACRELRMVVDTRAELKYLAEMVGVDPDGHPMDISSAVQWELTELRRLLRAAQSALGEKDAA